MDFQRYNIREKQKEKGRKKEKKKEKELLKNKQTNKQTIKKKKPSTTIQRLYMVFALKKKERKKVFLKQTKI